MYKITIQHLCALLHAPHPKSNFLLLLFIGTLFTTAKTWKQAQGPLTDD